MFTAVPDTNTTIYVQWNEATPIRTHPLLLRYEVLFNDTVSNESLTFGPFLSTQLNYTITDLEPNTEYVVSVVATSLRGLSDHISQSVITFPNRKCTKMVANISVKIFSCAACYIVKTVYTQRSQHIRSPLKALLHPSLPPSLYSFPLTLPFPLFLSPFPFHFPSPLTFSPPLIPPLHLPQCHMHSG